VNNKGIFEYPEPSVAFDWGDSAGYAYHTFGVEILPNEIRFLYDSNVVRRIPDRLIPPGHREYDVASKLGRTPPSFYIGQLDYDRNGDYTFDPYGIDSTKDGGNYISKTFRERTSFEQAVALGWHGFEPATIGSITYPAAHDKIDYVRVWDVPRDQRISNYPH
jgi:hypothetical protein